MLLRLYYTCDIVACDNDHDHHCICHHHCHCHYHCHCHPHCHRLCHRRYHCYCHCHHHFHQHRHCHCHYHCCHHCHHRCHHIAVSTCVGWFGESIGAIWGVGLLSGFRDLEVFLGDLEGPLGQIGGPTRAPWRIGSAQMGFVRYVKNMSKMCEKCVKNADGFVKSTVKSTVKKPSRWVLQGGAQVL